MNGNKGEKSMKYFKPFFFWQCLCGWIRDGDGVDGCAS